VELIGRDLELAEAVERLGDHRLVTIIGPGGMGKTSLARAAVERVGPSFELGSAVVDLTRVREADEVAGAVAGQLGFPSFDALLNAPGEQPVLLLVDNCEHVTDAAAAAIAALLDACQSPTVLATSRSPLDLPGETILMLGPLATGIAGLSDRATPAVRLFYERARDAGVTVPPESLDDVAELCRQLDGIPLAIEIAAARSRSLSPSEITARLDRQLDVLRRPRFRGASRHRSLRETIDWSFALLDAADQDHFTRLAVFAGPFTGDMAHAVAGGSVESRGSEAGEDRDWLDRLVADSLVVADRDGPVTRYRLLDTLRAYGREQADARGTWVESQSRLADHLVAHAVGLMAEAQLGWRASHLVDLLQMYDSLVGALRFCMEHDETPDRALVLLTVLWGVVHQSHAPDIEVVGQAVLDRWPDPTAPLRAEASATVATARHLIGDHTGAIALAEETLGQAAQPSLASVMCRRVIAQALRAGGDLRGALASFTAAADDARAVGAQGFVLELEVFRAQLLADLTDVEGAIELVRTVRDAAADSGSQVNLAWALAVEGDLLLRDDVAQAELVVEEGLALARRIEYPAGTAIGLRSSVFVAVAKGQLREAAARALAFLDESVVRGELFEVRMVLETAAVALQRAGRGAWTDLLATARHQPMVTLLTDVGERFRLPDEPGRVLPAADAVRAARAELKAVLADGPTSDSDGAFVRDRDTRVDVSAMRRRGDVWEVAYRGREVSVRASKGLDDIARLLAAPDTEVHCLDLVGSPVDESGTGEIIDGAARRQYEERVRELQADIEEAEQHNDLVRVGRAQAEMDALVDQLTSALGLAGRSREAGGSVERARSTVTQRVRGAVRKVTEVHPELGRHLDASIRTGTYCTYRPEHPVAWEIDRA
jgi:predicted ATPase